MTGFELASRPSPAFGEERVAQAAYELEVEEFEQKDGTGALVFRSRIETWLPPPIGPRRRRTVITTSDGKVLAVR